MRFYLAAALVSALLIVLADWASGVFPIGTVNIFHVFLAILWAATLWFMHYLDRTAARALGQAAPMLNVSPAALDDLRYRLTAMPAIPVLVLTVVGVLIVIPMTIVITVVDPQDTFMGVLGVTREPLSIGTFLLFIGLSYGAGFVFMYHTFRQLRLISRIYERDIVIDLTELGPLYAFSRVTALTALGIQVQAALWIVTNPAAGGAFLPVTFLVALTFVAAVIFIVPLWGVHRRIAGEKARLGAQNARGRELLVEELRDGMGRQDLSRATQIKDALLALEVEAKAIAAVRTWPWEPETLRLLLTAVLLPTALFVVQFLIGQLLRA